ncbi:S-adenosyl-L-methionine-dependent methyltransferase [Thozetella sp. PMI_491]|nr:S-adenosyl-L-methionine-dependent methyltransferase [Thozetella sp. PMI_491]
MSQVTQSDAQHRTADWSKLPEDVFKFMETRNAENSAAYLLPTLNNLKDKNAGVKLLDVGAGPGSISCSFAQILGPEGHVTAVDFNPTAIDRAKAVAEMKGVTNISFQVANARELPFEDDTFDVVHCHQTLAHNKDPWKILREMLRVTKPGGIVAAREGDTDTEAFWPPLPGLLKFHTDLEVKFMRARGSSSSSGRELVSWALKANGGVRNKITSSFSAWSFSEPEDRKLWGKTSFAALFPSVHPTRLLAGISEADMDEMRAAWIEWQDRDDATLTMLQGEIIMRK